MDPVAVADLVGPDRVPADRRPGSIRPRWGVGNAAWPMFGVSLLYTIAYAFSITRYKLMQVEEIINRSAVYFAFSLTAGLIYSGVLLVSGKLIGDQLVLDPLDVAGSGCRGAFGHPGARSSSEVARGRFQRVIDRQFFREKYKFDRAMQKMSLAVGSLIDRVTLGRRLLEAAAEVLRLEWGAFTWASLRDGVPARGQPRPDPRRADRSSPIIRWSARLRQRRGPALARHGADGASDPATDAMIALGGEAAAALGGDGHLAGLLVLGPKRSGMPYEDEEMAFLGALSSVATLVLHSADIQQTLESLNQELRDKVEKIAEQQRRILILQDQLKDRAERERERSGHRAAPAALDAPGGSLDDDLGPFRHDQRLECGRSHDDRDGTEGRRNPLGGAHPGRKRHGQGAAGRGHPSGQPASGAAVRQAPLRGPVAEPARKRAVRPRQGCVHRRRSRSRGPVRASQRRHALPRRDRRHQPGSSDEALARPAGDVVRAGRQLAIDHR